jgi:acylphosphatase
MAKELILRGKVQGVFCRNYCSQYAASFGIKGSSSNLYNGTVQVLVDCDDAAAAKYVNAIKENPLKIRFYGQIDDVEMRDYNGPLGGDYNF